MSCPRYDEGCGGQDALGNSHVDGFRAPEAGKWFAGQMIDLARHGRMYWSAEYTSDAITGIVPPSYDLAADVEMPDEAMSYDDDEDDSVEDEEQIAVHVHHHRHGPRIPPQPASPPFVAPDFAHFRPPPATGLLIVDDDGKWLLSGLRFASIFFMVTILAAAVYSGASGLRRLYERMSRHKMGRKVLASRTKRSKRQAKLQATNDLKPLVDRDDDDDDGDSTVSGAGPSVERQANLAS